MRFLCRLGWHRWEFKTMVDEEQLQESTLIILSTNTRCQREGCPGNLWWVTVDREARELKRVEV